MHIERKYFLFFKKNDEDKKSQNRIDANKNFGRRGYILYQSEL
jgi:hypothetical protein